MIRNILIHLILCLAVVACAIREEPLSKDSLECLLSTYLEYRPEHLNGEVLFAYTEGWTDSTAIIRILTINTKQQKWKGTFYVSQYLGEKVYLRVSKFTNGSNTKELPLESFPIPNRLKFKKVYLHTENRGNMNPEFAEVNLEYQMKEKCFLDVLMGNDNAHAFLGNCESCK